MGDETECGIGEAKDMRSMDRSIAWWLDVLSGGKSARVFMMGWVMMIFALVA